MSDTDLVAAGGVVPVAGQDFRVRPLSARDEVALYRELGRRAKLAMGPGGYFARLKPRLEWLAANKQFDVRALVVAELTRLEATTELPADDVIDEYRRTPEGAACELFWRTRRDHPEVTEKELRAVITDANAGAVFQAVLDAVRAGDPKATPSPSPPPC